MIQRFHRFSFGTSHWCSSKSSLGRCIAHTQRGRSLHRYLQRHTASYLRCKILMERKLVFSSSEAFRWTWGICWRRCIFNWSYHCCRFHRWWTFLDLLEDEPAKRKRESVEHMAPECLGLATMRSGSQICRLTGCPILANKCSLHLEWSDKVTATASSS